MKTNNKTETIAVSVFKRAALAYFKCRIEDIKIRTRTKNKEVFIEYKGNSYLMSTHEKLREDIEYQLTDKDAIHHIHLGCWLKATKNTVEIKHILGSLVRIIQDTEDAKKLLIAIQLGSYMDNTDVAFWEILSRIDKRGELLANAMIITAQVYSGPGLIEDLTELQIMNGNIVYNRIEGGIFETLYANDDEREYEFHLYSTDYYFNE